MTREHAHFLEWCRSGGPRTDEANTWTIRAALERGMRDPTVLRQYVRELLVIIDGMRTQERLRR